MKFYSLFLLVILCHSCLDTTELQSLTTFDGIENAPIKTGAVNFSDLQVGQKSYYARYTITCDEERVMWSPQYDTLVLEVVQGEDFGDYLLKEYFTPASEINNPKSLEAISYPIYLYKERINLPFRDESALFFFYDNDDIQLNPTNIWKIPVYQEGCDLRYLNQDKVFDGFDIGLIDELKVDTIIDAFANTGYGPLYFKNKAAVSCRPVSFNQQAYLIYDHQQLLLSYTYSKRVFGNTPLPDEGNLWVLLQ